MGKPVFIRTDSGELLPCPGVEIVYSPKTPEEGARIVERAQEYQGTPFFDLPGNPPEHKVVGELADGFKVRALHAETIYNDALMMDYCYGDGHYYEHADAQTREVLELARKLYVAGMS